MANWSTENRVRRKLQGKLDTAKIREDILVDALEDGTNYIKGRVGPDMITNIEAIGTGDSTPGIIRLAVTLYGAYMAAFDAYAGNGVLPEKFEQMRDESDRIIDMIKDRKIKIPGITTPKKVTSTTKGFEKTFNVDDPTEWIIDEDRLDAIDKARD